MIVVYPAGSGRRHGERLLTWNAETCCAYAQRVHIDETAFVRALLDTVRVRYSIDPARVYATGLSNGGMMAHLVGCRLSDRFAAIAVVSGELTVDCKPKHPGTSRTSSRPMMSHRMASTSSWSRANHNPAAYLWHSTRSAHTEHSRVRSGNGSAITIAFRELAQDRECATERSAGSAGQ